MAANSWRDILGVAASIGCAIHCAAMPIVIGYLPVLGLEFLADESFHRWMAFICIAIALAAFVPGWRKHGRLLPASVGATGLCLITATAFMGCDNCCAASESAGGDGATLVSESASGVCTEACCHHAETGVAMDHAGLPSPAASDAAIAGFAIPAGIASWLTPLGGLLLVVAHLLNHRATCSCRCCGDQG